MPAMSHRDRVLMEKERRREEAQRREEQELRRIREANMAHQRMRVQDRKEKATANLWGPSGPSDTSAGGGIATTNDRRKSPVRSRTGSKSRERIYSGEVPEYGSYAEPWHADPYDGRKGNIQHSPRRRTRGKSTDPSPPRTLYGEPTPPHQLPRNSSHYNSWRSNDVPFRGPPPARQPMHSVCLEALDTPERGGGASDRERLVSWCSEESNLSSGSLSEVDEWDSATRSSWADDKQRRQRALQQKIDECRAAIVRHKMTIAMLHYQEQEQHEPCGDWQRGESMYMGSGDEGGTSALYPAFASSQYPQPFSGFPGAPTFIQDFTARLQRRCLEGLGLEKFRAARRCLRAAVDAAEVPGNVRGQMLDLLGMDKIGFLSLLDQLVHMERRWGAQEAV
mmetsp:Transcript_15762/g.50413  ORF Transcript_15762/g.50413 Transcript_15762/m.50413 type:complete len:394 (-) Transcript_15762:61-1242(-)